MIFPSILSLLAYFPVLPGTGTKLKFLQIVWLDTDLYAIGDSLLWSNEIELIPKYNIMELIVDSITSLHSYQTNKSKY